MMVDLSILHVLTHNIGHHLGCFVSSPVSVLPEYSLAGCALHLHATVMSAASFTIFRPGGMVYDEQTRPKDPR
ncbi:hypothetical protein A0H81_00056 [Grifola frondosa]|uniref:Uncharacterized protein n=1 Tax=Grifola frondosa TaxID=5627 RepID=A0A1C7MRP9_GRIFR|nr:hypothetical protein A0H81_00056 [Grifola frondosa]